MDRLIGSPNGLIWDQWVYNADSADIARGESVKWDPDKTLLKLTNNPMYTGQRGPLESSETVPVIGVLVATVTASTAVCGVAQTTIKTGEWGQIRSLGYGVAAVNDTASDNHLTAYGEFATTDAWLAETNPTNRIFAYQCGTTTGTASAGDLRQVFINCLFGRGPKVATDHIIGTAL